jgi:hypothetical protein
MMQGLQQFLFVDPFSLHSPYEREGCRGILEDYVQSRGGLSKFGPTERLRITVLQEAVNHNDWIFLFLHHIISQHFLSPGFVPLNISSTPNFSEAVNIMNAILGTPQLQDTSMITFFAAFPCQLGLSLSFNPARQDGLAVLGQFIPGLPGSWKNLQDQCRQRQYPPTIPELAGFLKLISPTFMRIFFTAARRVAWPCTNEQEQGSQMTQIFQEADSIFTRMRETFFNAFHTYNAHEETRDYLRLQSHYFRLCLSTQGQVQQSRNQPNQIPQNQGQVQRTGHVQGMRGGGMSAQSRQVCHTLILNGTFQRKIAEVF